MTNQGPDAVGGVYLSDRLDTGTSFVSASLTPSAQGAGVVGFALGSLASGASVQVAVTIRVDTPSLVSANGDGQTLNTAVVSSDRPDPNTGDNQFVYTAAVNQRHADLALTVTPDPSPVVVGSPFVYRLVVTNNGPDDAQNVVLTENLPAAASFLFASPAPTTNALNVLTFNLGTIVAGKSQTVLVHMNPIGSVGSFILNTASVSSPTIDTTPANNTSSLQTVVASLDQAELAVSVAGPQFSVTFDGLSYTVTVFNDGPHAADHVVFTGEVTALDTITSITPSQGAASQSGNIITADLGTIAPDASATITFLVNAPDSDTSVTVKASVTADETDPFLNNNRATLRTKVGEGAITFVVTNTNDSGPGSLRQAIEDSEAQGSTVAQPNHIVFAIPETDPGLDAFSHAFVIQPLSGLPALFTPTIIDGYTEAGSSPNTNPIDQADNAVIRIEIDGSRSTVPNNIFTVFASNCVFRGLAINRAITKFQAGTTVNLLLDGAGIFVLSDDNIIEGCFIGTDATGTIARGNEVEGIALFGSDNTVGGLTPDARNVISGNGAAGIGIASSVTQDFIIGNFIGTDATGARALPTNLLTVGGLRLASIGVLAEGFKNTVGGTTAAARNVISGNSDSGVGFIRPQGSLVTTGRFFEQSVLGNYIGTDLTGTKALPNGGDGIYDETGSSNIIGGTTPGERNIISGNQRWGAEFKDNANVLEGNYVGTDVTGLRPLGNGLGGVNISTFQTTIGGSGAGAGNLIAGNNGPGVQITGQSNTIAGNAIGLDADGNPLGNNGDGVNITGTASGGSVSGMGNDVNGNTIAFNFRGGVTIASIDSSLGGGTGNSVEANSIHDNAGLGIDLGQGGVPDGGVTPDHDPLVTSPGGNHLQNFPVLTSAISDGVTTTIQGMLAGLADRDYTIHFYSNPYLDPSGFGEGTTYLGSVVVHTGADGNAVISAPIAQALDGLYITATASTGNPQLNALGSDTSEFSQGILVTGPGPGPISPPSTSADLAISASLLTPSPVVGGLMTYRFTVTNLGADPASTVIFSHSLPAGLQLESVDSDRGAVTTNGNILSANLGTLAAGEVVTITVNVTPTVAGALSGTASVVGATGDPDATNNSAAFDATVGAGSLGTDVVVSIIAAPSPVPLGAQLLYTIRISNDGPRVATGIFFHDTLPAGVSLLTANNESTPGLTVSGRDLSIFVGALAPGDFVQIFVAVQPTVAGPITNVASATLTQADLAPANNSASVTTTVLKAPSVTVVTSSLPSSDPGQSVTFTATVTSPTVGRPTGSLVFREGTTVLASRTLDANGAASFNTSTLSPGTHTITASYSGDATFQPSDAPVDQPVAGAAPDSADLGIQVAASTNSVILGTDVSFTITVTNGGPNAATNVVVSDALPAGFTVVSTGSSKGSSTHVGNAVTAALGSLASGASATVTVVASTAAVGSLTNAASVGATESDPNSANNTASAAVLVLPTGAPTADLALTVSPSSAFVAQGQSVAFFVTLTNDGPNDASGVTLTYTLPAGLDFVATSQGSLVNGLLVVPIASLANGASASVTVVATANGSSNT